MHVLKEFTQARVFGIIEQIGRIAIIEEFSAFREGHEAGTGRYGKLICVDRASE